MPLRACGGTADQSVQREHWKRGGNIPSGPFSVQMLEGGHFFINNNGEALRDLILH